MLADDVSKLWECGAVPALFVWKIRVLGARGAGRLARDVRLWRDGCVVGPELGIGGDWSRLLSWVT